MSGLAQKMFLETYGSSLGLDKAVSSPQRWSILGRLLSQGALGYVDYAIAELLLKKYPQADESAAALICHLSVASRQGHLCIKVDGDGVMPDPLQCWNARKQGSDDPKAVPVCQADLQEICRLIKKGAEIVPHPLVTEMEMTLDSEGKFPSTPICRFGNLYYFQRNWHYESRFLRHFSERAGQSISLALDMGQAARLVDEMHASGELLKEQGEAILLACKRPLTILCGGPGTGKTYTAGRIINVIWNALPAESRQKFEIALAAPTGKAAANLQQSIGKAVGRLQGFPRIEAKTLHALLGIKPGKSSPPSAALSADVVIVDESSMIDVQMMGRLFAAVKPGSRLILLGDNRQLPSVEAGSIFAELIEAASNSHGMKYSVRLRKCMRAELKDIVNFAEAVNDGNTAEVLGMLRDASDQSGVKLKPLGDSEGSFASVMRQLIDFAAPYFDLHNTESLSPKELFDRFNCFRILCPLRGGPLGIDEINRQLLRHFFQAVKTERMFAAPIMVVKNDPRLELSNGEIGVLLSRVKPGQDLDWQAKEGDCAWFPGKDGGDSLRRLPALVLPRYEYAYAITVHKSQGSEFNNVLLVLPEGAEFFGREVPYTGVTRARKRLDLWTNEAVLLQAIGRQSMRISGVGKFLDRKAHK